MGRLEIADSFFRRLFPTAFAPLVALVFLLGAGAARAAVVILDDAERSVLEIQNLEIPTLGFYNVEFLFTNAISLYGEDLLFDLDEEDAALALIAINMELNEDNRAVRAGPESTLPFAIGVDLTNEGPLAALGGKYFPLGQEDGLGSVDPMTWDACRFSPCLPGGATLLDPGEYLTYASFEVVPEPGTAALLGLGLTGLGVAGRKPRKNGEGTA